MPSGNVVQMSRDDEGGLVSRIVRAVNDRITGERLRVGDSVPSEASFAAELGVSRTVVREAFRALASLGVLNLVNGRRARVGATEPAVLGLVIDHAVNTDRVSILQIYDVRRTLEMRTVALAALRRSEPEAEDICHRAAAMREAFSSPTDGMEHDIAFHTAIAAASRNPLFALIVDSFEVITRQTWQIGWDSRPSDAERLAHVEIHAYIAKAIAGRDPKAAAALMAEHFDNSVKTLLAAGIV